MKHALNIALVLVLLSILIGCVVQFSRDQGKSTHVGKSVVIEGQSNAVRSTDISVSPNP